MKSKAVFFSWLTWEKPIWGWSILVDLLELRWVSMSWFARDVDVDIALGFQTPKVRMYLDPKNIPKTPNLRRYLED